MGLEIGMVITVLFGVISIALNFILALRPEVLGFFRIRSDKTGSVFVDKVNIENFFERVNAEGFTNIRDDVVKKFGKLKLDKDTILVSPSEVDYLLAFFIAAKMNMKFAAINTDGDWSENDHLKVLKKERYNSLLPGEQVILFLPVITTGEFLDRLLRYLDSRKVRIAGISCVVDVSNKAFEDTLRKRNLSIVSLYSDE